MAFPTLSGGARVQLVEKPATNSADLRNETDSGYVITRGRLTRTPTTFVAQYGPLTDADHTLLVAHIAQVGATTNFDWTHPTTAVTHDVRYTVRPTLTYKQLYWYMSCELEEI